MSEAAAPGLLPGRVALSELIVTPSKLPPQPAAETVDYYDVASFGAGVPAVCSRTEIDSAAQTVEPNDVLLSSVVDAPRRAWVVGESRGRPQAASCDWLVLRPGGFAPAYLRHLLVSNDFHLRFVRAVAAARKVKRARAADIGAIDIPVPPVHEQERIGEVLRRADGLRMKRQAVGARLQALPHSLFRELFGDRAPASWPLARIADLLAEAPVRGLDVALSERGEWLVLRASNVGDAGLDLSDCRYASAGLPALLQCSIADGDLLLRRGKDARGIRAAIAYPGTSKWCPSGQLVRLRFDPAKVCPEYARAFFVSGAGQTLLAPLRGRSQRRSSIEPSAVANLEMPLAPVDAQQRFVAMLHAVRALDRRLRASARRLDDLLGALRDAAFRGELRVA